ncbi:MAG TPA: cation:proton antiporter, partial [Methanocellaceae archaeon]
KKQFLIGGTLQVILTFLAATIASVALGISYNTSILIGFAISLSSTAIVLRLLQDSDDIDSPHGRIIVGILIFQDIASVAMMLVIQFMTGASVSMIEAVPLMIVEAIGIILLVIVATVWVVPRLLRRVARTRSQELFMLSVVVLLLAMVGLTSSIGLSLALGAFLAGLIISESQYSHQALGGILPFRYVFTSFFFISIGMLLDIRLLWANLALVLIVSVSVLVLKAVLGGATTLLMKYPMRTAVLSGLAISQVGEFSFIILKLGSDNGLLSLNLYQFLLSVAILTMAVSPFLISLSSRISDIVCKLPLPGSMLSPACEAVADKKLLKDHLIIIGYGLNGRNLSKAAKASSIPYAIIEMNPDTVAAEKAKGEPIIYGDATNEKVLEHLNIEDARVVVIAISDMMATRRVTSIVRTLNPKVHIIVRTRYLKEMGPLYDAGANEVIPEEFETSVEIFARVLKKYLMPKEIVDSLTADLRSESYDMLRSRTNGYRLEDLGEDTWSTEISTIQVKESCAAAGKTIKDIELRKKLGVTILLVKRGQETIYNPGADTILIPGDLVFVFGEPDKIIRASKLFIASKTA